MSERCMDEQDQPDTFLCSFHGYLFHTDRSAHLSKEYMGGQDLFGNLLCIVCEHLPDYELNGKTETRT